MEGLTGAVQNRSSSGSSALLLAFAAGVVACAGDPPGEPLPMEPIVVDDAVDLAGGRPFVVSPDGRWLAYSVAEAATETAEDRGDGLPAAALGLVELESFRVLDLTRGEVRSPTVDTATRRLLEEGHLPAPTLRCWSAAGATFYVETTAGSRMALRVGDARLVWRPPPEGDRLPPCPEREVPRTPLRAGEFEVTATGHGGLRVVSFAEGRVVFESSPMPGREHRLRDVALSPDGRRLVLAYSAALGSFSGPDRSALISTGGSTAGEIRALRPPPLYAAWHPDGQRIFGFARVPDGERHGIYGVRPDS